MLIKNKLLKIGGIKMYNLELSKKEIQTILMAFKDSEEKLNKLVVNLRCDYSELSDNLKLFWRNREHYVKHTKNTIDRCFIQIDKMIKLEKKIENIL